MAVSNLMVKNGINPNEVPVMGVGSSAGAIAAVKNRLVDAIVNLDPVISKLELDGDITVAVDTRTREGMTEVYGGEYHAGCIYAPAPWCEPWSGSGPPPWTRLSRQCRKTITGRIWNYTK
jgi:NitT/TauT family transport system substrate-binding protein